MNGVLSFLGLALRGGRLAVGEEPAALAVRAGEARLLLLAGDAGGSTVRRAERLAEEGRCLLAVLPAAKEELGHALGRGSAAVAALTDLGMAAALTERLAAQDPERYGGIAERMQVKLRRAEERRRAPRRPPPETPPPGKDRGPDRRRRDRGQPKDAREARPAGGAPSRRKPPYDPRRSGPDSQRASGRRDAPERRQDAREWKRDAPGRKDGTPPRQGPGRPGSDVRRPPPKSAGRGGHPARGGAKGPGRRPGGRGSAGRSGGR